ncbi:MAG: tetratricopeptide repeat protein, partial [Vicinamibacterales bacterium]
LTAVKAGHPALRAAAIASLGNAEEPAPDSVRSALVAALSDERRAVRIAAMVSLINVHGSPLASPDVARLQSVGREFAALSILYEDDAGFDRDLGMVRLLTGDYSRAADALQICLRVDPRRSSAGFLLALARIGQGRIEEARALLEHVPGSDPSYAAARRRLQLLQQ